MAAGMAAIMIVTTAVVVVATAAADATIATTVSAMVRSRSLMHNQWRGPVRTGAANGQVAAMAKDVVAINNRSVLHRKTLHLSSNSPPHASSNPRVNKRNGKQRGQGVMHRAVALRVTAFRIKPSLREYDDESIFDRWPCRLHVPIARRLCGGRNGSGWYLDCYGS